jgi:hypothetical protein
LSKRDEQDVADALLVKAGGDEAGLRALADHPDVPDHVADAAPLDRTDALATVAAVREWATGMIGAKKPAEPPPSSSPAADASATGE